MPPLPGLQPCAPLEDCEKLKDDPFLLDMPLLSATVPVTPMPEVSQEVHPKAPERSERPRRRLELPSGLELETRDFVFEPMELSKEVESSKSSLLQQRLKQMQSEWLRDVSRVPPPPADVDLRELRGSAAWLFEVLRGAEEFVPPPWLVTADELPEKGAKSIERASFRLKAWKDAVARSGAMARKGLVVCLGALRAAKRALLRSCSYPQLLAGKLLLKPGVQC